MQVHECAEDVIAEFESGHAMKRGTRSACEVTGTPNRGAVLYLVNIYYKN